MDDGYVFLISAHNDMEVDNVIDILEVEGIETKRKTPENMELVNTYTSCSNPTDIYVSKQDYEKARQVVEIEMVRGDF